MLKTLRRASQILHRVSPRLSADETVLTIDDDGGVKLRTPETRQHAQLDKSVFAELIEQLEQFRFKRVAGTYGDAMAEFVHDLEVHEGPGKKGRITVRLNHEYGSLVGDAPPGIREFLTLLDRLERYMLEEGDNSYMADEAFLDQLAHGIDFPYFNPNGRPGSLMLIDASGAELPSSNRDWQLPFADGLIAFKDKDGLFGFMKASGEVVMTPRFQLTYGFSEGLAPVKQDGKWGYITTAGGMVIDAELTAASAFSDGMAEVSKGETRGYINRQGEFFPAPRGARQLAPFSGGYGAYQALSRIGEPAWGYVDRAGKVIIKPTYEHAGPFAEGVAPVLEEDRYGFIKPDGEYAIQPQFDSAGAFRQGLAAASLDGRCGYVGPSGEWAITPRFTIAHEFAEGLAAVKVGRRFGYIDRSGELVIEPKYELAEVFSDGRAAVRLEHRWGYVDTKGALVIEPKYESARPYKSGVACVRTFAAPPPLVATGSSKVIINLKRPEPETSSPPPSEA